MGLLDAIILGIIQGLSEFLPISSSGHLEMANVILGTETEDNLMMTVVLHAATALSTVVIFRKEIMEIIQGLLQFQWNDQAQFSVKIILSMFPAAAVGLLFEEQIDALFEGNLLLVGGALMVTAVLLFLADKAKKTDKNVSFVHAIIIGISQAIAILPGISRSGATISTSVLLGIDRERSARFSFLMVVPLILGKMAKDILDGAFTSSTIEISALTVGFIAAFVTGAFACTWMIKLVKKSKLTYFSIYCLIVGAIAFIYAF